MEAAAQLKAVIGGKHPVHRLADDPLIDQLQAQRGGMDAPCTGHAALWWDRQEWTAALSSPEGLKAFAIFLEDERAFIDHSRSAF